MIRIENVNIRELILVLAKLNMKYDVMDLVVDPKNKRITLDPITIQPDNPPKNTEITDDNIEDLI